MIDHRKLLIMAITVSLIGVSALFLYSTALEPSQMAIFDIGDDDVGTVVTTNGTVTEARILSDGSILMTITDLASQSSISGYVPESVFASWDGGNVTPGALVELTGEVSIYDEELEITVDSADDLEVLKEAVDREYQLWEVIESLELMKGLDIITSGTVRNPDVIVSSSQIVGTAFELVGTHEGGTIGIDCIIFGEDISSSVSDGATVSVHGVLEFYRNRAMWQIVVQEIDPLR